MTTLAAIAHIAGAVIVLFLLGWLVLFIALWEAERNKKRVLQEVATKLGVPVDALDDERFAERLIQISSERSSNELLRNRISDLCGLIRTAWDWLGLILQVLALGATIWYSFSESRDNAPFAWLAPGIAILFWISGILFSLLCFVVTGRYPGEAKVGRKGLAEFLSQRRASNTDA